MLHSVPGTRSLCEPSCLDSIAKLYQKGEIDLLELRHRYRDAIRFISINSPKFLYKNHWLISCRLHGRILCKTTADSPVKRVVIKMSGFSNPFLDVIRGHFPQAKSGGKLNNLFF